MKKVFMFVALAFIASASVASAEMTLLPSSHPVYSDPAKNGGVVTIIGYISDIDWNRAQEEATARNGQHLPVIGGGVDITDEAGVVYKNACSQEGVSRHQCVVLTGTKKYHEDMLAMAKSIIASGAESAFPRFAGWFKLAK